MRQRILISVLLAAITVAVFSSVCRCDFVNYDDPDYVTDNAVIQKGVTWEGVVWAFGNLHGRRTYWHPVTWLSHMLDVQLFGLNARGHHAINLLLHSVNVVLLFVLLNQLTGAIWRSAVVALIFAIHPLQVESVAWVTERKNMVSGMLWILSLAAYGAYVRDRRRLWYCLGLFFFAFGLMSKPTLITLPVVLVLLDIWPLRRVSLNSPDRRQIKRIILEKIPFVALSIASGLMTVLAHDRLGLLHGERLSLWLRLQNAVISFARYVWKFVWPHDLAVFYPHPGVWPVVGVILATCFLLGISACFFFLRRRHPELLVGWLWFLVVSLPTIGIIQAGIQAMADRFVYLPLIGLAVCLVWSFSEWARLLPYPRAASLLATLVVLFACALTSMRQAYYWSDSVTLWRHALAATPENYLAHQNLASALYQTGQREAAKEHVIRSLQMFPEFAPARCQLGQILSDEGRVDEAIVEFQAAAKLDPKWADIPLYLARSFSAQGKSGLAAAEYRNELRLEPDSLVALNNLAWILATSPDPALRNGPEAVRLAQRACTLTAGKIPVYLGTLAAALAESGQFDEAAAIAQRASDISLKLGERDLAQKNDELVRLFRSGAPYRERL